MYMSHACDLVPYDDPNYEQKVREIAEGLADAELNPDPELKEKLCQLHDESLDFSDSDSDDNDLPF